MHLTAFRGGGLAQLRGWKIWLAGMKLLAVSKPRVMTRTSLLQPPGVGSNNSQPASPDLQGEVAVLHLEHLPRQVGIADEELLQPAAGEPTHDLRL